MEIPTHISSLLSILMRDTDNFLLVINNFLSGTKFDGVPTKDAK